MKINIENEQDFTQDELKFLQLLEEDETFEKLIQIIRKVSNLPLDPSTEKDDPKKANFEYAMHGGYWLTKIYGPIPIYWFQIFGDIILSGIATPPNRKFLPAIEVLTPEEVDNQGYAIAIVIRENLSIRQIKKFIEKSKVLKEELKHLPNLPNIALKDLDIKKRMLQLKREGKKDSEIASQLEEEYGDKLTFSPDYDIVSVLRNRFEKDKEKILKRMDYETLDVFLEMYEGKLPKHLTKHTSKNKSS